MITSINEIVIDENDNFTALGKARADIQTILENSNYNVLDLNVHRLQSEKNIFKKLLNHYSMSKIWIKKCSVLPKEKFALVQFPPIANYFFLKHTFKVLKRKNIKLVAVIHDLETMRYALVDDIPKKTKLMYQMQEIPALKQFDLIIVHNSSMKSFLKKKGIDESRMISLGIFDYLIPDFDEKKTIPIKERKNSVIIAGNLSREKSEYIYHLPKNVDFDLYGMHYEDEGLDNICYHGAFPANELPLKLNGRFGLVWDGYSANGCQGTFGQYLKLNNPHKTSLYLASGIPVIIWEKAALAPFIVENNLGIAVNDLSEIKDKLLEISDMQYNTMAQNVKKISNKLRNGYYIKAALESIDR